ncbi:hypothetical protein [Photobacterium satsumensis]|uniref:hypothetical protein n=1 Tax=Photobacterium satsumensis TaxID=2910239 RepID=UPI003D147E8C
MPNCLDGYVSTTGWELASRKFYPSDGGKKLIIDPQIKSKVLAKEAELKGKHLYYLKRFCNDTYSCDICGQTKLKINVFVGGDDGHYLACVRCKRP